MSPKSKSKNIPPMKRKKGKVVYNETPRDEDDYSATHAQELQDENGKVIAVWTGKAWINPPPNYANYDDQRMYEEDMELHYAMEALANEQADDMICGIDPTSSYEEPDSPVTDEFDRDYVYQFLGE